MLNRNPRKTKIVCTLGPATAEKAVIREMILKGMNAARFNFSHGDHESHLALLTLVREAREELNAPIATILDTRGPEIRTKTFPEGSITLEKGASFTLRCDEVEGSEKEVSITYENLYLEITPGSRILIDDGLIELLTLEISGKEIRCVVLNGGVVGNNKSINLPDCNIALPSLTDGDERDIAFAVEQDFDYIAASFVRKAADVEAVRRVLNRCGGESIRIISKIENREGVDNADEIIEASDGIMVARGDLGVEIPAEEVPIIQKRLIAKCVMKGKPVITATQMLDSMMRNPRPTRAEVNDVANAVFDGTSTVMLSGETASGKYPIEALTTMARVAETAERADDYHPAFTLDKAIQKDISGAISHACCTTAGDLRANAIISVTKSGHTPRMISRFRPRCPIAAVTPTPKVVRQLAISWGVVPCYGEDVQSTDELFKIGVERTKDMGLVEEGDTVVITAGVPTGVSGTTNLIKAQKI